MVRRTVRFHTAEFVVILESEHCRSSDASIVNDDEIGQKLLIAVDLLQLPDSRSGRQSH